MADTEFTPLDDELHQAAETFAEKASSFSGHPLLREGLAKMALNSAIWSLYHHFPDAVGEMADHLDIMGDIIRHQASEDMRREREERRAAGQATEEDEAEDAEPA